MEAWHEPLGLQKFGELADIVGSISTNLQTLREKIRKIRKRKIRKSLAVKTQGRKQQPVRSKVKRACPGLPSISAIEQTVVRWPGRR